MNLHNNMNNNMNNQEVIDHVWKFGFGGMLKEELNYLFNFCEDKKILELGSELGQSSYVMATIAESVTCVDAWDDNYEHLNHDELQKSIYLRDKTEHKSKILNNKTIFEKFKENCKEFIDINKIKYIKGSTNDVHIKFENNFFDIILIDADHSFKGVCEDINNYLPKLKKDGLLLFHDFNDGYWVGVTEATKKFVEENKIEYVTHYKRIGVFKIK
jgi:predicted O-methyltransferase YrrM